MESERYYVDQRVGCVAVRDRLNTDREYQGLHSDTQGVMGCWYGRWTEGSAAHPGYWSISPEAIDNANELCDKLNQEVGDE